MKRALAIAALLCLVVGVVVLLRQTGDRQSDAGPNGSAAAPSGEPSRDAGRDGSTRAGERRNEEFDDREPDHGAYIKFKDWSRGVAFSLSGEPWHAEVFRAVARTVCAPGVLPAGRAHAGFHVDIFSSEATDVVGLDFANRGLIFKSKPRAREVYMEADDDVMAALDEQLLPWTVSRDVWRSQATTSWTRTDAVLYLHRDDCEWAVDGEPPPGREYGATCEFIPDIPGCNAE